MYVDDFLMVSDAQEFLIASAASTDYVDTLAAGDAVSPGSRVRVSVQTAFTTAGTPTLVVGLQSDTDSAFGTDLVTHISTTAALAAALTLGTVLLDIQLPIGIQRYIRMYYTLGGSGVFTAGKLDAMIALDTDKSI